MEDANLDRVTVKSAKPKLFQKYALEVPEDAVQIISALDDPIRRATLALLTKKEELSFSELQKALGVGKLTLNYHLKTLFAAGLTDHYFKRELGNPKYSYYAITALGNRILAKLAEALTPPLP
jgi:DNA-binding transcriptional ArsR family regulator